MHIILLPRFMAICSTTHIWTDKELFKEFNEIPTKMNTAHDSATFLLLRQGQVECQAGRCFLTLQVVHFVPDPKSYWSLTSIY